MSIAIPTLIEKDIRTGKARYSTFQTGIGGQSVLKVPSNSYIIIFGYDYSPAGGGFLFSEEITIPNGAKLTSTRIAPFETQQISFYTGQAFHPFIHHVDIKHGAYVRSFNTATGNTTAAAQIQSVDNKPQTRSTYIISNSNVDIMVGLLKNLDPEGPGVNFGPIDVTQNTPNAVSYGNDGNLHAVQTFLSSATGSIFTQPSPENVDFYGTGFAPLPNAESQVYLKPEPGSAASGIGLIDPSEYIESSFGTNFTRAYATHYFLNVHYALYTNTTPEQLG
jgi:hypothetical protein